MKKAISYITVGLLLCFYSIGALHITLIQHYCNGELQYAIPFVKTDCCCVNKVESQCTAQDSLCRKTCCENRSLSFASDSHDFETAFTPFVLIELQESFIADTCMGTFPKAVHNFFVVYPPPIFKLNFQVAYQVFRL